MSILVLILFWINRNEFGVLSLHGTANIFIVNPSTHELFEQKKIQIFKKYTFG